MELRIENLPGKKLIGQRLTMSIVDDKTAELWRRFMPRRREIVDAVAQKFYSMQVYPKLPDFTRFKPDEVFEKWAGIEVSSFDDIPADMEPYIIKGGLYLVFIHKGTVVEFLDSLNFIHNTWLPNSRYLLDHREHFEILDERYKPNDPDSEEEVWIPVKYKAQ